MDLGSKKTASYLHFPRKMYNANTFGFTLKVSIKKELNDAWEPIDAYLVNDNGTIDYNKTLLTDGWPATHLR